MIFGLLAQNVANFDQTSTILCRGVSAPLAFERYTIVVHRSYFSFTRPPFQAHTKRATGRKELFVPYRTLRLLQQRRVIEVYGTHFRRLLVRSVFADNWTFSELRYQPEHHSLIIYCVDRGSVARHPGLYRLRRGTVSLFSHPAYQSGSPLSPSSVNGI